jgi:hypothetical protein
VVFDASAGGEQVHIDQLLRRQSLDRKATPHNVIREATVLHARLYTVPKFLTMANYLASIFGTEQDKV